MGMFDTFELKEGNQFELLPGHYQTKDLDCSLHVFSIDENNIIHGEIGARGYGNDELNLINAGAYNTTLDKDGKLEIYGPCSGPDELYGEYYLEIVNSKIISIMVYDEPYYHIDSGIVPESGYGKAAKNRHLEHEIE